MFSSRSILLVLTLVAVIVLITVLVTTHPGRHVAGPAAATATPSKDLSPSAALTPSTTLSPPTASLTPSTATAPRSLVRGSTLPKSPSIPDTSSNAATSPPIPGPTGIVPGLLRNLFPVTGFNTSWTTSPSSQRSFPLTDSTFRPNHVINTVVHTYANAPDGTRAMKAHYPEGSYTFGHEPQGGFSFYAPGPKSVDLTTAKEATFGYSVYFPEGFAFNLGGKLPGLYGGNSDDEAIGCSGGSRSAACFSARLMWREDGKGEFYTYLPPYTDSKFVANKNVCNVPPYSECNPTFGASVGRGAFLFAAGGWTTISERVRLNDVGQANGQLELFFNGKSVINVDGLILRDSAAGRIRGMQMQTFFGGSHPQFASPKAQDIYFSDFSTAITETL